MARQTEMGRKAVREKKQSQSNVKNAAQRTRGPSQSDGEAKRQSVDKIEVDANDVVREYYESSEPPSEEVLEEFVSQPAGTARNLQRKLSQSPDGPELYAGDIDAGWDGTDVGEEAVGGTNPTPDQDIVEEIGAAAGVTYQDTEPLKMDDKLAKRDDHRWELDPASDEDYVERVKEQQEINTDGEGS